MTSPPRKDAKRSVETHIYMTPIMKRHLEQLAAQSHRSVNGQILFYIQRGIEQDDRP